MGCGSSRGNPYSVDVGTDDGGLSFVLGSGDAGGRGALDAHIEENHITITFVTLSCSGGCATVEAVATGGYPPYTFAWDDGSTHATRQVCPAASTSYNVKVTDTGTSGELARPAQSVDVPLSANVIACSDAGPTGTCDSFAASFSPAGVNPNGAWSYGSSTVLGSAFSRYTMFVSAANSPTQLAEAAGLAVWITSPLGNPTVFANPTAQDVYVGGSGGFRLAAGQVGAHPGPLGEYSIARYTVQQAGVYRVQAAFDGRFGLAGGTTGSTLTTTDVHVQHNGVDVATGYINVQGGGNSFQASPVVSAAPGDTIDFAVGSGGNGYTSDSTGIDAVVCKGTPGDSG